MTLVTITIAYHSQLKSVGHINFATLGGHTRPLELAANLTICSVESPILAYIFLPVQRKIIAFFSCSLDYCTNNLIIQTKLFLPSCCLVICMLTHAWLRKCRSVVLWMPFCLDNIDKFCR